MTQIAIEEVITMFNLLPVSKVKIYTQNLYSGKLKEKYRMKLFARTTKTEV